MTVSPVAQFIYGAIMLACLAISLFFFKHYRLSKDRLLLLFSIAFVLLAVERFVLIGRMLEMEMQAPIYLLRLSAFILMIGGIVDKNGGLFRDGSKKRGLPNSSTKSVQAKGNETNP